MHIKRDAGRNARQHTDFDEAIYPGAARKRWFPLLAVIGMCCPPAAAQDQGFAWRRIAPPGLPTQILSDLIGFWQAYHVYLLAALAFLVVRAIWRRWFDPE
jgi:hypothetical protein